MKLRNLLLYTLLLAGLGADSHSREAFAVETTSATTMRLSAENYISQRKGTLPTWLEVLFFGAPQPMDTVIRVTLDREEIPEELPQPEPEPEPMKPVYTYGDPVQESPRVDDSFFDNAAIIGDSRSQGLMLFGDMPGDDLAGMGLSVYNIWDKNYVQTSNGALTCLQALERKTYDTIYIGLGANSLGYPSIEKFFSNYCKLIDEVRLRQPNAVIYVQNIIPMNEPILNSLNYADCFNNDAVREFNTYIQRAAVEKDLYFLDIYTLFLDETGQLPREASNDGLHLNAEYAKIWSEYLKTHTMDTEKYDVVSAKHHQVATVSSEGIYADSGAVAAS